MKKQISKLMWLALLPALISGCRKDDETAINNGGSSTQNSSAKVLEHLMDVPIDGVFFNECCNEEVYITGTAHILVTTNIIHLNITNQQGTGLTTGYSYTQVGQGGETNVFYSNQFAGTLVAHINMSNNNGCSFKTKAHFHTTVNANGEVTSSFQNLTTDCE